MSQILAPRLTCRYARATGSVGGDARCALPWRHSGIKALLEACPVEPLSGFPRHLASGAEHYDRQATRHPPGARGAESAFANRRAALL
jgi:hypothetical protein